MPSLSKQQQKTLDKEYQNWLAVAHALSVMCDGIRPYIEREMRAFHQALLVNLAHFPPCACPRIPNHHETKGANACCWAKELKKLHRRGQPKWPQSDSTKWTDPHVGHCEVAKVYMSDLGPRAAHVNINNSDTTGLLNLLSWCNHFTVQQHLVSRVRQTRNTWGHSTSLKLSDLERNAAFQSIQDLLQDPTLATDPDALNALAEINNITTDVIAQDVERKLLREALNNNEQVMKDFREQMKKDRGESRRDRSTKDLEKRLKKLQKREREKKKEIEKRLELLETSLEKEREKMAEFEERIQSIEDVTKQQSFIKKDIKHMFIKAFLLLGMLMRFLQKFIFLVAFLGCFVLLDPTSYEDGCPMETSSILQPDLRQFNFTSYLNIAREGFIGRKWLFDTIEDVLNNKTNDLSAVVIVGEPGSGKSAIAAQLICSRSSSSLIHNNILGYHLCKHIDKMTQDGGKFVKSLVDMIARRIPGFMEIVSTSSIIQRVLREDCSRDPYGCLEQTIVAPLRQLKADALENKLYFIIVDAIDECTSGDSGSISISSISELLRHKMVRLPSWLKLIITARNDSKTLKYFSKSVKIDLFPSNSNNMGDIELFITKTLYEHSSLLQKFQTIFKFAKEDEISALTSSLLRQSQGNFLFVKELLHYWLADISYTNTVAKSIPPTIGGIYYSYFQRAYDSEEKFRSAREILEVLVATFVPLSQEEIYKVLHPEDPKRDYAYNDFMVKLNGLSHFLRYGIGNTVSLFHLSLLEWLVDENNIGSDFFVDKRIGHRTLANYYLRNAKNSSSLSQTSIFYLAQHIVFSGHLSNYYEEFDKLPTNLITSPIDDTQRTLLHLAAAVKNADVLRLLLRYFPRRADLKDNYGITPAFIAAAQGALENLEFLLDVGANISHRTNPPPKPPYEFHQDPIVASKSAFWSSTMLHAASRNGHLNVVKFLIERKQVSPSARDGVNFTALQLAAQNGHLEVVSFLHKNGAQTDQVALYHAAANGHDAVVKFLLQDAGVKDECMRCDGSFYWLGGKTRYQAALIEPEYKMSGEYRKLKSALWHLAQPKHLRLNVSDFLFVDDEHLLFCQTALHVSVLKGYHRVAQTLLLQSTNGLHCIDFSGRTPLHYAVRRNNKEIVELLLREGADVSQKCLFYQNLSSFFSKTSANSYRQYFHLSVMEELQYVSDRCPLGSTPMHLAARYGHSRMAAILKNFGASFYTEDFQGAMLLHIAACHGQTDFIQWLISSLSNMHINTGSQNGSTPLHSAAVCGRFEDIPILISLGATITSRDNKGMTSLHYTALTPSRRTIDTVMPSDNRDHIKVFKTQVLSLSRFRMWLSNDEELVRLDYFFDNGDFIETRILNFDRHCKTARRLMEHMDVRTINQADNLGRTALHLGAKNGLECVVGFLLANNANPQKENNAGLTPLEETIQLYDDPLASFDGFSMKLDIDKMMYDSLVTQTECKRVVTDPSMKDLIEHVMNHLDLQTAVVHIVFSWELEMQENGKNPTFMLHRAIEEWQPHLVLLLLLMGADVNKEDSLGRTPLLVYLQHGGNYTASILKQFNVQVPVKCGEPFASSPFHLLSYRAPTSQSDNFFDSNVEFLWDLELKTWEHVVSKCQDAEGYTPLHRAAQGGNIVAIETFLLWGVDVNLVSRDGHTPLFLAIRDAGLRPDLQSVIIDTTKASKTAILLFMEVLKKNNFKIKCDGTSKKLTIYHLAAYRGLDQFIHLLLSGRKPFGFNIDCPDKFGVTPLYLSKLFAGGEADNKLDPWKKIVRLIESYGGTLRYPDRGAELRLLYTHLYDSSKQPTYVNVGLANELLQLLESANNLDHCFRMFHSYASKDVTNFFIDLVMKPFQDDLESFEKELLNSLAVGTTVSDYFALRERVKHQNDDHINSQEKKPLATSKERNFDPNNIVFSKSAAFTELLQLRKTLHRLFSSQNENYRTVRSQHTYVHLFLSQIHDFFIRHQTSLSDFSSVRAMKKSIPLLHQNLFCSRIAFYKATFVDHLRTHLLVNQIENEWTWKRMTCLRKTPFMLSRLPLVLKDITDVHKAYSPLEAPALIHLIRIALRKRSKFDYLDMLAFGNDRSLWKSIHKFEFDLRLLSEEREKKLKKVSLDYVKWLFGQLKKDVAEKWQKNKAKVKELKTAGNPLRQEKTNPS